MRCTLCCVVIAVTLTLLQTHAPPTHPAICATIITYYSHTHTHTHKITARRPAVRYMPKADGLFSLFVFLYEAPSALLPTMTLFKYPHSLPLDISGSLHVFQIYEIDCTVYCQDTNHKFRFFLWHFRPYCRVYREDTERNTGRDKDKADK